MVRARTWGDYTAGRRREEKDNAEAQSTQSRAEEKKEKSRLLAYAQHGNSLELFPHDSVYTDGGLLSSKTRSVVFFATETHLRLFKKFLLFVSELAFLFFGFVFSVGLAAYLDSIGTKFAPVAFLLIFFLICAAPIWFRRKTGNWTVAADATVWLAHRSWRQLHPRRAKHLRIVQQSFLCFPSVCAAFVLFFLPVASHTLFSGARLVPHYRVRTPLNWLIIKSRGDIEVWTFFSNRGAAHYGFTPVWFNHSMPSGATFLTSDPASSDGWWRPRSELSRGQPTHVAVRQFNLGKITATCYEYRHTYGDSARSSPSIFEPPVLWESLCSTHPNGVDYNLRAAFFGHQEDLAAFYDLLNSASPSH
jgi:hypothetical protein